MNVIVELLQRMLIHFDAGVWVQIELSSPISMHQDPLSLSPSRNCPTRTPCQQRNTASRQKSITYSKTTETSIGLFASMPICFTGHLQWDGGGPRGLPSLALCNSNWGMCAYCVWNCITCEHVTYIYMCVCVYIIAYTYREMDLKK